MVAASVLPAPLAALSPQDVERLERWADAQRDEIVRLELELRALDAGRIVTEPEPDLAVLAAVDAYLVAESERLDRAMTAARDDAIKTVARAVREAAALLADDMAEIDAVLARLGPRLGPTPELPKPPTALQLWRRLVAERPTELETGGEIWDGADVRRRDSAEVYELFWEGTDGADRAGRRLRLFKSNESGER